MGACAELDCASRERVAGARALGTAADRAGEACTGCLLGAGEGRAGDGAVLVLATLLVRAGEAAAVLTAAEGAARPAAAPVLLAALAALGTAVRAPAAPGTVAVRPAERSLEGCPGLHNGHVEVYVQGAGGEQEPQRDGTPKPVHLQRQGRAVKIYAALYNVPLSLHRVAHLVSVTVWLK